MGNRDGLDKRPRPAKAGLVVALLMLMSACASAPPFQPQALPYEAALRARAVTKVEDDVRISATIPTREESLAIFGIDLGERDILPLWLEIENRGKERFFFLPTGLDPEYFAPLEAAFLYKEAVSDHAALGRHLQNLCFDSRAPIAPGTTESGFIFINAVEPSLVAQIDLFGWRWSKRFSLTVLVPGAENARNRVAQTHALYAPADLIEISDDARLREALEALPCCTTDGTGAGQGLPLNLVLIGDLEEAGSAFVRRGYRYSPADPLYALGRVHDLSIRKRSRWVAAQPHTLRFWLTPLLYRGKPIWVAQVSARFGGRFAEPAGETQTTEPAVDDARNDIVQDLLYSQSVAKLGFVKGVGHVAVATPRTAQDGSGYHTDGLRAVMVFRSEAISLSEIDFFEWQVLSPAIVDKRSTAE